MHLPATLCRMSACPQSGRTTVVVAHRLSTIINADDIAGGQGRLGCPLPRWSAMQSCSTSSCHVCRLGFMC